MKGWAVIVGILIFGMIFSSGCTQPASSPSTSTITSIQPTPLVTEQTSQPTVEVAKTLEKPLPLTETYSDYKGRFSFKIPSGYVVKNTTFTVNLGNETSGTDLSGWGGDVNFLYIVKKEYNEEYGDNGWFKDTKIISRSMAPYLRLYQNSSAIVRVVYQNKEDAWRWVVTGLTNDKEGNTYWMTYKEGVSDTVKLNGVTWIKIVNSDVTEYGITSKSLDVVPIEQFMSGWKDRLLKDWMKYFDITGTSDSKITYILRYRTPTGTYLDFDYNINQKINGGPIQTEKFNQATFEEIVKSFKYEEI